MEKNVINSVLPLFVKVLTLGLKNRLEGVKCVTICHTMHKVA